MLYYVNLDLLYNQQFSVSTKYSKAARLPVQQKGVKKNGKSHSQ